MLHWRRFAAGHSPISTTEEGAPQASHSQSWGSVTVVFQHHATDIQRAHALATTAPQGSARCKIALGERYSAWFVWSLSNRTRAAVIHGGSGRRARRGVTASSPPAVQREMVISRMGVTERVRVGAPSFCGVGMMCASLS